MTTPDHPTGEPPADDPRLDDFIDRALESAFFDTLPDTADAPPPAALPRPALPARVGRYVVEGLIGVGGMGHVFRGRDPALGRVLAIKVLPEHLVQEQRLTRTFLEEARLCSQLQHPGVVPIHEIGHTEDGRPFFAMKIVEGQTLQHLLRQRGDTSTDQRQFLEVFEKVCQTIAFAHEHGVLHRDLKSANVMVGAFGEVHVMDWGLALRFGGRDDATGGADGGIVGTPSHMAPEQARGQPLGPAADVFGLGSLLCEILTGAPAYLGESRSELFLKASRGWVEDAHRRLAAAGGGAELVGLARASLDPDPAGRPRDAGVLAARIRAHLAAVDQRARELEVATAAARARAREERRARRLTAVLAVCVVGATALGAGSWAWQQRTHAEQRRKDEAGVSEALRTAEALHRQAAGGGAWEPALLAAEQAAQLATTRQVDADLSGRVTALVAAVSAAKARAEAERSMVQWLEEIRPHLNDDRAPGQLDALYAAAFGGFGLDLGRGDDAAFAAGVAASGIRRALAVGLDDWAYLRRQRGDPTWRRLMQIASDGDPDDVRSGIRRAFLAADAAALLAVAARDDLQGLTAESFDLLARCLAALGRPADCLRVYRLAHVHHPQDFHISHNLADWEILQPEPDWPEVLRLFSMAVAARPGSAHAMADLGRTYMSLDDLPRARRVLERARELDPDYARTWLYLGVVHHRQGDLDGARRCLERTVRLDPAHVEGHRNLAVLHRQADRLEAAEAELRAALAHASKPRALGLMLAEVRLLRGDPRAALATCDAVLARQPADVEHLFLAGACHFAMGRNDRAAATLERVVKLRPDAARAWCNLGLAQAELGAFDAAVASLREGHRRGQQLADWAHPSGEWLALAEAMRAAHAASRTAATVPAGEALVYAEMFQRTGAHRRAAEAFRSAFADDPALLDGQPSRRLLFRAVCSAVGVGFGERDAAWREQARAWMRAQLDAWRRRLAAGEDRRPIRAEANHWPFEPRLAPARGALDELAPEERAQWGRLWEELEGLLHDLRT